MKTIKELKAQLTDNYNDNDEILVAYWDKEWVAGEFEVSEVELTDELWSVFKNTLEVYTKHNALSSDLISEVVYEVISKVICEICESNQKEYTDGKWCASCKDEFKESEGK